MGFVSRRTCLALALGLLATLSGCGAPTPDVGSQNGKQQLIDEVNKVLTTGDCTTAIELITPLYNSASSDNDVRLAAASAYGCNAHINYFQLLANIASNSGSLAGTTFWNTMAKFFPSTAGSDYVVEGAAYGTDALQAALKPGALILPLFQVNPGTYNVGSVWGSDRIPDANIYMVLIAMAGIGGLESRYGSPTGANFTRGALLPWTQANQVTTDGCAYAASILNFVDAIDEIKSIIPTSLANTLGNVTTTFNAVFDIACDLGCMGLAPTSPLFPAAYNSQGNWIAGGTGCSFPVGTCATCPAVLRDRTKCTQQATDTASCAAAGLANFVNSSTLGWQ